MIEGSGSGSITLTYGSGSESRRPKNHVDPVDRPDPQHWINPWWTVVKITYLYTQGEGWIRWTARRGWRMWWLDRCSCPGWTRYPGPPALSQPSTAVFFSFFPSCTCQILVCLNPQTVRTVSKAEIMRTIQNVKKTFLSAHSRWISIGDGLPNRNSKCC